MLQRLLISRFSPLTRYDSGIEKSHGRIERRVMEVLPAEAAGIGDEWSSVQQVCRLTRRRQRKVRGKWLDPNVETIYLITSLPANKTTAEELLKFNRNHWGIEIMHRDKDVILGE